MLYYVNNFKNVLFYLISVRHVHNSSWNVLYGQTLGNLRQVYNWTRFLDQHRQQVVDALQKAEWNGKIQVVQVYTADMGKLENLMYVEKLTPMKQTNSLWHRVLFGLLLDGGHLGPLPLQKLSSLQPLSSLHLTPISSLHLNVQQGP